ncbi:hypothetical protein BST61_g75 [Cercospora zeina]
MRAKHVVFFQVIALLVGHGLAQTRSFTCPSQSNQVITDVDGTRYILRCSSDSTPGDNVNVIPGVRGFNDCFDWCTTNSNCAGFTYFGPSSTNGIGDGTCYFKPASQTSKSTFSGNSGQTVSAIKLSNYPPLPPSYTCPFERDLTVATDPNTGVQYVMRCNSDSFGSAIWSLGVSDSFNDCFYQCSTNSGGNCTAFTYAGAQGGPGNGQGSGICYMKQDVPQAHRAAAPDGQYRVSGVQLRYYDGSNGAPYYPPNSAGGNLATFFPPAATRIFTQITFVTTTLLQPFPTTVLSTLTRLTTITSNLTLTATNLLTLPDATQQITSIQVIPTTIVTLQVVTITVSTISIQQIVTVVPTTVIQTLAATTLSVLATSVNTRTTVLGGVVTATPVQTFRQTVTVTAG